MSLLGGTTGISVERGFLCSLAFPLQPSSIQHLFLRYCLAKWPPNLIAYPGRAYQILYVCIDISHCLLRSTPALEVP